MRRSWRPTPCTARPPTLGYRGFRFRVARKVLVKRTLLLKGFALRPMKMTKAFALQDSSQTFALTDMHGLHEAALHAAGILLAKVGRTKTHRVPCASGPRHPGASPRFNGDANNSTGLYGLSGPVELFAVAVEAFFQTPVALTRSHTELYAFLLVLTFARIRPRGGLPDQREGAWSRSAKGCDLVARRL